MYKEFFKTVNVVLAIFNENDLWSRSAQPLFKINLLIEPYSLTADTIINFSELCKQYNPNIL